MHELAGTPAKVWTVASSVNAKKGREIFTRRVRYTFAQPETVTIRGTKLIRHRI